jgi:hypothetical protein
MTQRGAWELFHRDWGGMQSPEDYAMDKERWWNGDFDGSESYRVHSYECLAIGFAGKDELTTAHPSGRVKYEINSQFERVTVFLTKGGW